MTEENATAGGGKTRRGNGADPMGPNSEIGRKLRQHYDELLSEEIPERFEQLLARLEQVEETSRKKD